MATLNDLPDPILSQILSHCPPSLLSELEGVCPRWSQVLENQGVFLITTQGRGQGRVVAEKVDTGLSRDSIRSRILRRLETTGRDTDGLALNPWDQPAPAPITTTPTPTLASGDDVVVVATPPAVEEEEKVKAKADPAPPPAQLMAELESILSLDSSSIRGLCFLGALPLCVPGALFLSCQGHLTSLHFHLSTLASLIPPPPPPPAESTSSEAAEGESTAAKEKEGQPRPLTLDLPSLKTFVLDSVGLERTWTRALNPSLTPEQGERIRGILDVALGLLEDNTWPLLSTLSLDLPFCGGREKKAAEVVTAALARHAPFASLRSFSLVQGFTLDPLFDDEDDEEEDDEAREGEEVSLSALAASSLQLKKVKGLKDIHIGLACPQESDPLWINWVIQQNGGLERLIFTGEPLPFPSATVRVNEATLTTLVMEVRDNVDCAALAGCAVLRKLSLLGGGGGGGGGVGGDTEMPEGEEEGEGDEGEECRNVNVNVFNLRLLPAGLESLRINQLRIERGAAGALICSGGWPNLRRLELISCGIEGNLGVPLVAIGHILQEKKLTWFQIDYSLNRRSVSDPDLPASLRHVAYVLRNNSISNFTLQGHLDGRGEYDPAPEPRGGGGGGSGGGMFQFLDELYPTGYQRQLLQQTCEGSQESSGSESGSGSGETGSGGGGGGGSGGDHTHSSGYEDISD